MSEIDKLNDEEMLNLLIAVSKQLRETLYDKPDDTNKPNAMRSDNAMVSNKIRKRNRPSPSIRTVGSEHSKTSVDEDSEEEDVARARGRERKVGIQDKDPYEEDYGWDSEMNNEINSI